MLGDASFRIFKKKQGQEGKKPIQRRLYEAVSKHI